jgi:patatin-like phospholipase
MNAFRLAFALFAVVTVSAARARAAPIVTVLSRATHEDYATVYDLLARHPRGADEHERFERSNRLGREPAEIAKTLASPAPVSEKEQIAELEQETLDLASVANSLLESDTTRAWPATLAQVAASYRSCQEALEGLHKALKTLADVLGRPHVDRANAAKTAALAATAADTFQKAAAQWSKNRDALRKAYFASTALVVSGGVSLGSYQGGFLHYYTEFLKAHGDFVRESLRRADPTAAVEIPTGVTVAAGASAGSINAFISLLVSCRDAVADPRRSLFWNAWIPVGADRLVNLEAMTPNAVLSDEPIDTVIGAMRDLWTRHSELAGWTRSCGGILGVSATRMRARSVDFGDGATPSANATPSSIQLSRQTEKFVIELRGQPGAAPKFFAYRPKALKPAEPPPDELYPTLGVAQPQDPTDLGTIQNDVGDVMSMLKASSAYPLAFPPQDLTLTIWRKRPGAPGTTASFAGASEHSRFTDGGVFDNTPLGLAVKISEWMDAERRPVPEQFMFMSSGAVGWTPPPTPPAPQTVAAPVTTPGPARTAQPNLVDDFGPFVGDFIGSSEDTELMNTVESHSDISRSLPARQMPVAGEQLNHFFAFFEPDFREFDFFMGMVDAREYVEGTYFENFKDMNAQNKGVKVESREFSCFDAYRHQMREGAAAPDISRIPDCGAVAPNLIALLKSSRGLMSEVNDPARRPADEFERFVELLQLNGYDYKQLRYRGDKPKPVEVRLALRETANDIVQQLGKQQGGWFNGYPVWVVGKALANDLAYRPPSYGVDVGLNLHGLIEADGFKTLARWGRTQHWSLGGDLRLRLVDLANADVYDTTAPESVAKDAAGIFELAPTFPLEWAESGSLQVAFAPGYTFQDVVTARSLSQVFRSGPEANLTVFFFQRLFLGAGMTYYVTDSRSVMERQITDWRTERREIRGFAGMRFFN